MTIFARKQINGYGGKCNSSGAAPLTINHLPRTSTAPASVHDQYKNRDFVSNVYRFHTTKTI